MKTLKTIELTEAQAVALIIMREPAWDAGIRTVNENTALSLLWRGLVSRDGYRWEITTAGLEALASYKGGVT